MEPTNKAERKKAYINFMLLFLLCSAVIVATVISGASVPLKQNEELREFRNSFEKKNDIKKDFTNKMIAISILIDSLDQKNKPTEASDLDSRITKAIDKLDGMFTEEENDDNRIYKNVIKNLRYYRDAKKAAHTGTENDDNAKLLNEKIERLTKDNNDLTEKYIKCLKGDK